MAASVSERGPPHSASRFVRALDRYLQYLDTSGMPPLLTRAERQQRTREELVDAAELLFSEQGFHATSIDAVAAEAGFTKGAVYSNFESKEDLFFAVYERRVDRRVEEMEAALSDAATAHDAFEGMIPGAGRYPAAGDGWLAVFFEFWAHVLRHPELKQRFAEQHRRVIEPLAVASERLAAESGTDLPDDPYKLATARFALQLGIQLERLTQPDVVDPDFGRRMGRLFTDGGRDGLPR
jgi:AcrR family transcriptional regulator